MLYRFTDEVPASQLDHVVSASLGPRLWINDADYPDLDSWGERMRHDLQTGAKIPMVAYNRRAVAGSIIFRPSDNPTIFDIRRISIMPSEVGRGIASFLLRSTEVEAMRRFPEALMARVDAKLSNRAIRAFLCRHGYVLTAVTDLYGLGTGLDAVYCKSLAPQTPH